MNAGILGMSFLNSDLFGLSNTKLGPYDFLLLLLIKFQSFFVIINSNGDSFAIFLL